jgi:hypothetical protein
LAAQPPVMPEPTTIASNCSGLLLMVNAEIDSMVLAYLQIAQVWVDLVTFR